MFLAVNPQVPLLYSSIGVMSVSYSFSLFCSDTIFRFQRLFRSLNAVCASILLLWMSSCSLIRLPNFLTFFHSSLCLFTVVSSVLFSLTLRLNWLSVFDMVGICFLAS